MKPRLLGDLTLVITLRGERAKSVMRLPADRAGDLHSGAQPLAQRLRVGVGRGSELLLALVVLGERAEQLQLPQHRIVTLTVHRPSLFTLLRWRFLCRAPAYPAAGSRSVWMKSDPLKSSGSPVDFARA